MWLDNFNEMRRQSGLSLDELSEKSGVPKGTLSKISAGITERPALETMRVLVYAMGYTLNDLEDNTNIKQLTNNLSIAENNIIKKYRTLDKYGKETVSGVLEFEYKRCREQEKDEISASIEPNIIYLPDPIQSASAGHGQLADDDTANMIAIQANTITSKANYIMRVSGDSMEPKFFDGQRVLVRNQPSVDLGEIGIFLIDGERYIKIYRGNHLESANPNYPDVQFDEYSKCLGRVLDILKDDWIIND